MPVKHTLMFNWGENRGWTESFYSQASGSPSSAQSVQYAKDLAAKRLPTLTTGATLLAVRISDWENPRIINKIEIDRVGTAGKRRLETPGPDVVNLALLVNLYGASGERRSFLQRGLCDGDVIDGYVTFSHTGRRPYDAFWDHLVERYSIQDTVNGEFKVVETVAGDGMVTTAVPHGLTAGDRFKIQTRTAGNGLKVNATGIVETVAADDVFFARQWAYGTCTGGKVCQMTRFLESFSSYSLSQPAYCRTRQTGRPFGLLRGRQSNRTAG
jgi:hypothetical protein